MSNPTRNKLHSVTEIAAAPIERGRFVNYAGTHAAAGDKIQGVSEAAAAVGRAVSLVTGYSALVELAGTVAKGDDVGPAGDGSGRGVAGVAGGVALAAGVAGELVEVRVAGARPWTCGAAGDDITVGVGGEYSTLEEAAERAAMRTRTSERWARILIMPSTTLTLSAAAEFPEYCEVVGASRKTSRVIGSGDTNIRYRKWNRFSNFTLLYSGIGASSGGFRNSASIGAAARDGSTVEWINLDLDVTAERRSAIWAQYPELMVVDGCRIRTSGIGLEVVSGYDIHCRNTEIYLTDVNTGQPHIGVRHMGGRLTMWSPKIACGYGPLGQGNNDGISDEADKNIIGIYSGSTGTDSRCDIFDLWSIIRNQDGADPGVKNVCVWNDSNFNVTRIWGGYLQVENGDNSSDGDNYEILNTGTPANALGLVQVAPGVRARRIGGPVHNTGPFVGMPPTITANTTLGIGQGGLHRINASAGAVTVTLPNPAQASNFTPNVTHAERYVFKRMAGANTITIAAAGAGVTVDGAASVTVPTAAYSAVELVWCADSLMWLVV